MTWLALTLGLTGWLSWLMVWWAAALQDWRITLAFNAVGEQWVEGVLFHAAAVIIVAATVLWFRLQRARMRERP